MKQKTVYVCDDCGYECPKWMGKCPSCNQWNTLKEFNVKPSTKSSFGRVKVGGGISKPVRIEDIKTDDESRFFSGISELDRVLGGGAVKGSFVLVGGEPGIGKSTLLLQMCKTMSENAEILYVSGEESLKQIKLRAGRLNISSKNLYIMAETDLEEILSESSELRPDVLIIDSIQTVMKSDLSSAPGNISQIKECAMELMRYAKRENITIFIVGHVNKDGNIAGPKILEHMVDCVLYFEGDRHISYRLLRAEKNRYGSTNELGVFEMSSTGLVEISNPSAAMLAGRLIGSSGNCIAATIEGTRPILAEVQALVTKTAFGVPRRTAAGIDYNRMVLLLAILEKRVGFFLSNSDAYVNVVGGMKLAEPAIDLPIILAITSSYRDTPVKEGVIAFGEVGLTGELRAVSAINQRINEARRMGFTTCIIPDQECEETFADIKIVKCSNISDAISCAI